MLSDNTSIAVARILETGERIRTQVFGQLLATTCSATASPASAWVTTRATS